MNIKKIFKFALLSLLPLTSCYFDVDPSTSVDSFYDKRKIIIGENDVVVNVGEEKFVEVEIKNLDGNASYNKLVFTSSDTSVATAKYGTYVNEELEEAYKGMLIKGKKVGATSIIASYKNACASVDVNVIDSREVPYIHLFDSELCIETASDFVLPNEIIFKGESYSILDGSGEYDFTYLENEPTDIVSFTTDEETGDIIISPLKVGSTKVLVNTTFMEKFTSTLLTIEVIEPGVGLIVNNPDVEHLVGNKYRAKLMVNDGQDFDLDIDIYRDDELVLDTVALTSDNTSVVQVDGYIIKGISKGTAKVTGIYQGVDIEIEVIVDKNVVEASLTKSIVEVDVDSSLVLQDTSLISDSDTVVAVHYETLDGDNIFDSYDNSSKKVKLDVDEFHKLVDDYGENKRFYIETENKYIETNLVNVYSKVIKNYNDLASWGNIAESYITDHLDFNGYFVLGNSIDCGGNATPVAMNRKGNFPISGIGECKGTIGFNGVFDGQGYTINNYKPTGFGSFITWLTKYGKFKNIGFTNVTLDTSLIDTSANPAATVIVNGASKDKEYNVSNVYVQYASITTGLGKYQNMYCGTMGSVGVTQLACSNVFIDATSATISGDFDVIGKLNCDGVYAIGGTHINSNKDFGQDSVVNNRIFYCSGVFGHFDSSALMAANSDTREVVATWDTTYWSNLNSGVPSWKSAN